MVLQAVSGVWLTYAHELGHQLGAIHPWGSNTANKGKYGGIMDYANGNNGNDKRLNGEHQFNAQVNKGEVCGHLNKLINGKCTHFSAYETVCGDGVLTDEEECECAGKTVSCRSCQQCKLANGAVCTPDDVDPEVASKSHITIPPPFFKMAPKSCFEMCFASQHPLVLKPNAMLFID